MNFILSAFISQSVSSVAQLCPTLCDPMDYTGFPLLHYLWDSLIAQLVKNLPAVQETLVQFLDQEDHLEKG